MLNLHRTGIEAWPHAPSETTALAVPARLEEHHPERFAATHLRTTQRMVKAWRAEQAKRMIRLTATALTPPPSQEAAALPPPEAAALGNVLG